MLLRARKILSALGFVAFLVASIALVRDSACQGQDFDVFWRTARFVMHGQPAYDLSRDGAMVFKYPPWIIPFFFPFALISLAKAKWIWGLVQVVSLLAVLRWVLTRGVGASIAVLVAILYWGIWAVHAMDGQVSLPILAVALTLGESRHAVAQAFALLSLTTKIFSFIPTAEFVRRWSVATWIGAALTVAILSVPACITEPGRSASALSRSWQVAAASGGASFEGEKVRSRDNQGFPALVMRARHVPATDTQADLFWALGLTLFFSALWYFGSLRLNTSERIAGWFALICIVHPLAWFHLFVFSFPCATLALWKGVSRKSWLVSAVAFLGVCLVTVVTRKTFGAFGEELELLSVKAWGTLLCLTALAALPSWRQFEISDKVAQ